MPTRCFRVVIWITFLFSSRSGGYQSNVTTDLVPLCRETWKTTDTTARVRSSTKHAEKLGTSVRCGTGCWRQTKTRRFREHLFQGALVRGMSHAEPVVLPLLDIVQNGMAHFHNWLLETRRTMYARGFSYNFHSLKLIHLNNRAAPRAFPSRAR